MSVDASRRWMAARVLHEDWQVPLAQLNAVLGYRPGAAERRCKAENWKSGGSIARLRARLIDVFDHQLAQFEPTGETLDLEKECRALSVLAKTLESLVASDVQNRKGANEQHQDDQAAMRRKESADDSAHRLAANTTADLDRQLTTLIGNLAQKRSVAGTPEPAE